jgi:6-phosphogluconolactonase
VNRRVRIFRDLRTATSTLADHVGESARAAVGARGRFLLVLSGGSTPEGLFRLLAGRGARGLPWRSTEVFFSDERCVPPHDPQSNYGQAESLLLSRVPVMPSRVHRLRGDLLPPQRAAEAYELLLARARLGAPGPSGGRFDLVLLGVGEDGHTASLFPGSPALRARRRKVRPVPEAGQPPYVPRLTLTLPALAASREICFLAAGASKARAVSHVFREPPRGTDAVPASRVRSEGPITWYLDRAAAAELPRSVAERGRESGART